MITVSVCLHTIKILLMTFLILCTTFHDLFTQFSSVAQLCLTLCDPIDCSIPVFLSITNFRSLLELMSIESVMPSNHLILCHPLPLPPSIFPSIISCSLPVLPASWPSPTLWSRTCCCCAELVLLALWVPGLGLGSARLYHQLPRLLPDHQCSSQVSLYLTCSLEPT